MDEVALVSKEDATVPDLEAAAGGVDDDETAGTSSLPVNAITDTTSRTTTNRTCTTDDDVVVDATRITTKKEVAAQSAQIERKVNGERLTEKENVDNAGSRLLPNVHQDEPIGGMPAPLPSSSLEEPVGPGAWHVARFDATTHPNSGNFSATFSDVSVPSPVRGVTEALQAGLAVASFMDDDNSLPIAQEMQQSEPAKQRSISCSVISLVWFGSLVVVVLIIMLVLVVDTNTESDNDTNSTASFGDTVPTVMDQKSQLLSNLPEDSVSRIQDGGVPQTMAIQWLLEDPSLDQYDRWQIIQRFALATLYFATDGVNWVGNTNWLSYDKSECDWFANSDFGIANDEARTAEFIDLVYTFPPGPCGDRDTEEYQYLMLSFNGLQGRLPEELYLLTNLRWIYILANLLAGTLSPSVGKLTNLEALAISHTEISGTLPTQLGQLSNMNGIFMFTNKLAGTIPTELAMATSLSLMILDENQFTGRIPSQLGMLPSLMAMHLHTNALSGLLPSELGLMTSTLMTMECYENNLSGHIPTELGMLRQLSSIRLNDNLMTGTLPDELFQLTKIETFRFMRNGLHGTIPSEVGFLTAIRNFRLSSNRFSGALPSELGLLKEMTRVSIEDNNFSGPVPVEIFDLWNESLRMIDLDGNPLLSGIIPVEACSLKGDVEFDCPSVCGCDCPCFNSTR